MTPALATMATRARFELRRSLSPYPSLFLPLMRRRPAHQGHVVDDDTEVMIEGFPRSGNTFAVAAFQHAQRRPMAIARHLHAAGHAIEGVRRSLPVMIVVRDPIDAVVSEVIRHPQLSTVAGLREYLTFHRPLFRYADRLTVAPFEQVTSNFGAVIDRLNRNYGTNFARFEHTPDNVAAVFEIVDRMDLEDRTRRHDDSTATVGRPTAEREEAKETIRARLMGTAPRLVDEARRVREAFLAAAR